MSPHVTLILGGARSGKSAYAIAQGDENSFESLNFLATASAGDEEMKKRIERHRADRNNRWNLVEEPYHLAEALTQLGGE